MKFGKVINWVDNVRISSFHTVQEKPWEKGAHHPVGHSNDTCYYMCMSPHYTVSKVNENVYDEPLSFSITNS